MANYVATATTVPWLERKDPSDVLDYVFDWSDWLETGETIASATFTTTTGITQDSDSNTTTTATVWLSSGTAGETYTVGCLITTNMGRECERSCRIVVSDR